MIDDLDAFKYLTVVQPITECMNHSTLKRELTHHENVPFSSLILAYTTASYNKKMDVMTLRFNGATLQLISMLFCMLLGLKTDNAYINDELVSLSSIIRVYHQMGYKEYFFYVVEVQEVFSATSLECPF